MKHLFIALSVLTLLSACGNKDSGNNNQPAPAYVDPNVYGASQVNLPPECGGPATVAMPNEYENAGCQPYNWDQGHFRHGGCPRHTFAACAVGVGMVCMPQDIYNSYNVSWFTYTDGRNQMGFCGYAGAQSGPNNCSYRTTAGSGTIGRACLTGGVNECGYGHCQAIQSRGDNNGHRGPRNRGRGARPVGNAIGVCVQ